MRPHGAPQLDHGLGSHIETVCFCFVDFMLEGLEGLLSCESLIRHVTAVT